MRKFSILAVSVILVGVGAWAATTEQTPYDAPVGSSVDPLQMMMQAGDLPTEEFIDYSVVFPVLPEIPSSAPTGVRTSARLPTQADQRQDLAESSLAIQGSRNGSN
jgi:hypothetical protein